MTILINIDVPDLRRGIAFYADAFGLNLRRRLGTSVAELSGWPASVFLLEKEAGSIGAGSMPRQYDRHWTPVHLDIVVEDVEAAVDRAIRAGATMERTIQTAVWGRIAGLADPFGHGFCLIQFLNRGYDEIASVADG